MSKPNVMPNMLFTGDNLDIMNGMNSDMVDLIYTDPPFNSKRFYSAPVGSKAAGTSFNDIWTWQDVDVQCLDRLYIEYPHLVNFIQSVSNIHSTAMASYLTFMTQRIIEMHRILKPTGSMYLHIDPTASHYLKIILDRIFGRNNFRNEVVWHYNKWTNAAKHFQRNHDIILVYSKKDGYTFNKIYGEPADTQKAVMKKGWNVNKVSDGLQLLIYNKVKSDMAIKSGKIDTTKYVRIVDKTESKGTAINDVWNIKYLHSQAKERTGFRTQKPLDLLRRIIEASSNQGDIVMDPFCGCATAMVSAQHLHRKWIGIDIELQARDLVMDRLSDESSLFDGFTHVQKPPTRDDIKPIKLDKKGLREQLHKEQKGVCNGCMNTYQIKDFHIDHILPRAKGGQDNIENLQLLCGNCNSTKGDRTMDYLNAQIAARMAVIQRVSY